MLEIEITELVTKNTDGPATVTYSVNPEPAIVGAGEGFAWYNNTDDVCLAQIEVYQIRIAPGATSVPMALPPSFDGTPFSYQISGAYTPVTGTIAVIKTIIITEGPNDAGDLSILVNPLSLTVAPGESFCWKNASTDPMRITQSNMASFSLDAGETSNQTAITQPSTTPYTYNITGASGLSTDPEIVCDPDAHPTPHAK